MPELLTTEIVRLRLKQFNPNVRILGEYVNSHSTVKCECKKCSHVWFPSWGNLRLKHGCPKCARNEMALTTNEIKRRLAATNPKITILSDYQNKTTPLKCKCTCGHKWTESWQSLRCRSSGCPLCCRKFRHLNIEVIKAKAKKVAPLVEIIGKYTGCYDPLRCHCKRCDNRWDATWNNLSQGHGCPKCGNNLKSEEEVRNYFEDITGKQWPKAKPSQVPFLHGLHLDGYCAELKVAFEYQGLQHYRHVEHFGRKEELADRKRRDARKRVQCWRHGVRLIAVPYWVNDKQAYIKKRLTNACERR